MRTTRSFATFVALLAVSSSLLARSVDQLHERFESGAEPAWVQAAVVPTALEGGPMVPDEPVEYLLIDTQVNLPGKGPMEVYRHWATRLNSRAVLAQHSSLEIRFEPSYQHVVLHHVRIYRDGRWTDRIGRSRWSVSQRETDLPRYVFDGRVSAQVLFDDVRVGDVISVAYTVIGENPVFTGRSFGSFRLGWSVPVNRFRVRVRRHEGRDLRFESLRLDHEAASRRDGSWVETVWDLRDLDPVEGESFTPYDWVSVPRLRVSEYGDWTEVVNWALPLYRDALDAPAELDEIAKTIAGSTTDDDEKILLARNWVQDEIRYQAVALDKYSHAPHRASDIVRRRYGDCKDKTVLLIALLRALDVRASPALVNTEWRDGIRDWLPSPDAFDHVIVAAGPPGSRVWIDPTLTFQGGQASDLYVPDYGLALVVAPGQSGLIRIPAEQTDPGTTRVTYRYDIDDALSSANVEIVTDYEGHQAESMRGMLAGTTVEDLADDYLGYYRRPGLTVEATRPLHVDDDRKANVLRVIERYAVTQEPDPDSGLLFETLPLLVGTDLPIPEEPSRTVPVALPHPLHRNDTLELRGATGVSVDPIDASIENPWFRFSARTIADLTVTTIHYELETLSRSVPVDQLDRYTEDALKALDAMGLAFWDEPVRSTPRFSAWALAACFGILGLGAVATYVARRRL